MTSLASAYKLILYWMIQQIERQIPAGIKALIFRRYILLARTLNRGLKEIVEKLPFYELLQRVLSDGIVRRTAEFHNRSLGFPKECETIVFFLQRFQRSYQPKKTTRLNATVCYDAEGGIKEITYGIVVMVHDFWVRTWSQTSHIRGKSTRRNFARSLASFLLDDRRAPGRNLLASSWYGRSQSIPRIASTKLKSRRTRSVSPGLL